MHRSHLPLGELSVNFVNSILRTLEHLNISSQAISDKFQLSSSFLDTPGAQISIPKFMRIGHEAIQKSQLEHFGLLMGQHIRASDIGLAGFAAMSASTIGEALQILINYETLSSRNSRGHSTWYREDDKLICQFYSISPYNSFNYFVVDSTLSSWHHFAHWLNESPAKLVAKVEVEYPMERYRTHYEKLFNCPIEFAAKRNALIFYRNSERSHNRFANKLTCQTMLQLCEDALRQLQKGKSNAQRVIELISQELSGKSPGIDHIASKMGIAGWTLRRRLKAEGKSFNLILDETRQALALTYVRDTQHNFTEIAFLLGFSSPAAFQRAFKRWTGKSPGAMRQD